jgi:hypothetical protein
MLNVDQQGGDGEELQDVFFGMLSILAMGIDRSSFG